MSFTEIKEDLSVSNFSTLWERSSQSSFGQLSFFNNRVSGISGLVYGLSTE